MTDEPTETGEGSATRAVAIAIHGALSDGDEGSWPELSEDEQENLDALADHAIRAHIAWLTEAGFRIAPPGTMLRPKTEADAKAMLMAAQQFLQEHRTRGSKGKLIGSPALIIPKSKPH